MWEPGLGIVTGNLACEPVPGSNLIGNLVPGVAEDPKLLLLGKKVPKQVPRKRLPSRYPGRGSQARLSSSEPLASTVPKNGSQARFQAGTRLAGTGSQASVPRKSCSQAKFPGTTGNPCLRTSSWEPCLRTSSATLLEKLFLGTLLGNLFLETLPGNFFREPYLWTCSWETCMGTCSSEPVAGNLAWEPLPENLAWEPACWELGSNSNKI